jgi:hypothetical protein
VTTIAEVRQNLADIADTLHGWHGSTYVGDSVVAGAIKVFRPEFDPRVVFGGGKRRHSTPSQSSTVTGRSSAPCSRRTTGMWSLITRR